MMKLIQKYKDTFVTRCFRLCDVVTFVKKQNFTTMTIFRVKKLLNQSK